MDFSLTDEQSLLRTSAREFLDAEWPASEMRRMLAADAAQAADAFWSKTVQLGWPGLIVPEQHDGLGAGVFDLAVLMEQMGRRLIPSHFFAGAVLAPAVLSRLGSDQAKSELLPKIAAGEIRAALALDRMPAWLKYAPGLAAADLVLIAAADAAGAVKLYASDSAAAVSHNSLDPTRPLGSIVARGNLVGEGSQSDLEAALDIAAVGLAAEMVGGAAQLLDMTVAYVKDRKQFGVPVGAFQAVQHRAADMLTHVQKSRSAVYYAALVADEDPQNLSLAASTAKVAANQAYVYCGEQAIQLHGGIGFTWEQDLHLYFKRAKSSENLLGSTAWRLDRIAGALGVQ